MPSNGYSRRSLVDKLGIQEGFCVALLGAPKGYLAALGALPKDVSFETEAARQLDFIQFFSRDRREAEHKLPRLKRRLRPDGMLWMCWPKGSSGVETDLSENVVCEIGLANGLVDVKVCAVDETWSGLKLVYRLKDRQALSQAAGGSGREHVTDSPRLTAIGKEQR
jgi:hypothetical protein